MHEIGYTTGVYDLFHVGHLRLLRRASELCDRLIVGVTSDDLSLRAKGKLPVIPLSERIEIVATLPFVSEVVVQHNLDKVSAWEKVRFNKLFVGSDWQGTPEWDDYKMRLERVGAQIIFLPYTAGVSSTVILQRAAALEEAYPEK